MSLETENAIYRLERQVEKLSSRVSELEARFPLMDQPCKKRLKFYKSRRSSVEGALDFALDRGDTEAARHLKLELERIQNED